MNFVYHAVTGRPMFAGQRLLFDPAHPNGVCRRVETYEALCGDEVCDALRTSVSDGRTRQGASVDAALAELIRADMKRWGCVARRERALERVRRESYPAHPSRLACLYTSRTLDAARQWAQFFREQGRTVYGIVRLETRGRLFDGNACNCFDGGEDIQRNLALARRYWQNAVSDESPVIETLADGELVVREIIE